MIRTRLQGDTPFFPNMLNNGKVEVCLKEDVDKVIAEKDKVITYARAPVREDIKLIMHQKYKRCLDKAKLCKSEEKRLEAIAPFFDTDKECWEYGSDYYVKWHKRCLEIAEKFKEVI